MVVHGNLYKYINLYRFSTLAEFVQSIRGWIPEIYENFKRCIMFILNQSLKSTLNITEVGGLVNWSIKSWSLDIAMLELFLFKVPNWLRGELMFSHIKSIPLIMPCVSNGRSEAGSESCMFLCLPPSFGLHIFSICHISCHLGNHPGIPCCGNQEEKALCLIKPILAFGSRQPFPKMERSAYRSARSKHVLLFLMHI